MTNGSLFIISAPSGAGKSTILKRVMAEVENLVFSISHTTRRPRPGEIDGHAYHFVDRETFTRLRNAGGFLEWAEVHGNFYGTSREAVETETGQGRDVILDIDVQGAEQLRKGTDVNAVSIFVLPPSVAELERRLRGRGTESEETVRLRLDNAVRELRQAEQYDFLVVNDDLATAATQIAAVISAERAKHRRLADGHPIPTEVLSPPDR